MNLYSKTSEPYDTSYCPDDFMQDNILFNYLAGTYSALRDSAESPINKEATLQKLKLYLNLLKEEVQEGLDAFEAGDITEILDAAIDVAVVNDGLMSILAVAGADIDKACYLTAKNNLSKYPLIAQSSDTIVEDTIALYAEKGIQVDSNVVGDGEEARLVFKNKETGKILKPYGFEANDLSEGVAEDDLKNIFKKTEVIQAEEVKD
jgi:hypothetical protein